MKLRLASLGPLALLASSFACATPLPRDSARLERIWQAADERMSTQGDAWFEEGDFPRVVKVLMFRIEFDPHDYEIATDLGWMLENVEKRDDALRVYVHYRQQNPGDPDGPFPEANFYYLKKQYDKVPPLLEPTLARNPHSNSFRVLAHTYEKQGKLIDAIRVWEQLVKLHPDDLTAVAILEKDRKKAAGESGK
jgi:tetratricopeptide (TPR) repeat protein